MHKSSNYNHKINANKNVMENKSIKYFQGRRKTQVLLSSYKCLVLN